MSEGGKANKAICRLIARRLKLKARDITIETGDTNPEKIIRITGANAGKVRAMFAS